ncbi:MAG: hypothetical protein WAN22_22695 [Solirubrobacteraceae bacterium]
MLDPLGSSGRGGHEHPVIIANQHAGASTVVDRGRDPLPRRTGSPSSLGEQSFALVTQGVIWIARR